MELMDLTNHLLVAMPWNDDPVFAKSVIYICEHHAEGTVGLIINRPMHVSMQFVFDQLHIESLHANKNTMPVMYGGPARSERGFVIHRLGTWRSSLVLLPNEVTITTSNDIIRAIADDVGPKDVLVTLGYVSWGPHQVEEEIINNTWLVCPYRSELLYDVPFAERWRYAGKTLGIDMQQLTSGTGHA